MKYFCQVTKKGADGAAPLILQTTTSIHYMVSLGEVRIHTSCSTFWSGIHVEDAVLLAQGTQEAHKHMDKEGAVSSESARSKVAEAGVLFKKQVH